MPRRAIFLDFRARFSTFGAMQKDATNKPKRVLITGCSSGFGLLTAVGAAQKGLEVIATMRNLDKAGPLKEALSNTGVTAQIERLDTADP